MRKDKRGPLKRTLSVLLAVLMLAAMLPMSTGSVANALSVDKIEYGKNPDTSLIYFHNGATQSPEGNLASINVNSKPVDIHKYQLKNTTDPDETFWTYCSDFANRAVASDGSVESLRYYRTDIENVNAEDGFFKSSQYTFEEITAKLRAILLNSDLATGGGLNALQTMTGITGLTASEAIAGAQVAIWYLVNAEVTLTDVYNFAKTGTNVRAYFNYLIGLDGVGPDDMAQIRIAEYSKELDEADARNSYKVTIGYTVEGEGVLDANKPGLEDIEITASYTDASGTRSWTVSDADKADNGNGYYTVVISGIPRGVDLNVSFRGEQQNVNTVYLYRALERTNTQTLVSVINGPVPLQTDLILTAPGTAVGLTVIKSWKYNGEVLVPNTAAKDYESTFSITYNGGTFDGARVISDFKIEGNGSVTTPNVFEEGKSYKIEEILADGEKVSQVKYFTVTDGKIVWTDGSGVPLSPQTETGATQFTNSKTLIPGDVQVKKTVLKGENALASDGFTFEVKYTSPLGSQPVVYAEEPYELYNADGTKDTDSHATLADGTFTLKAGQYAVFKSLPPGSKLTVTELDPNGIVSARYVMDVQPGKTAALPNDGATQYLAFSNTYRVGSLTINKSFDEGSELKWAAFPSASNALTYTVTGPGNTGIINKTVSLYDADGHRSETLENLPIGEYTVTETSGAQKTDYVLTVNGELYATGKDVKVNVTEGGSVTAGFVNSYRRESGSLKITKQVTGDEAAAADGKTFTFNVYGPNSDTALIGTYTYTYSKDSAVAEAQVVKVIDDLKPGTYRITETGGGLGADFKINHNVSVSVGGNTVQAATTTGEVTDQQTVTFAFENDYSKQSGQLTVTKAISGALSRGSSELSGKKFYFKVTGPENYEAIFELPDNGNWSKTLYGLTPGEYNVTETSADDVQNYSYTVSGGGNVTVKDNEKPEVTVTNNYTRQKGGVSFKKVVDTDSLGYYNSDSFTFTVKVNGNSYTGNYYLNDEATSRAVGAGGTISNIKNGDTVKIIDLNAGDTVSIAETDSGTFALINVVLIAGTGTGTIENKIANTTIVKDGNPTFTFTNMKQMGNLKLTKSVVGLTDAQIAGKSYTFTVNGPKGFGTGGIESVTLSSSNSFAYDFGDVPYGAYTITEGVSTTPAGYTLSVSNNGVSTSGYTGSYTLNGATLTATFTNTYTRDTGSLKVTKAVSDVTGSDMSKAFDFIVSFTPALTQAASIQIGTGTATAIPAGISSYSFSLTNGQTATITGIPTGTEYAVTETEDDNYNTAWSGSTSGTIITKDQEASLTCTNTRRTGYLKITKNLMTLESSALSGNGTVTLVLTNDKTSEAYTVELSFSNGSAVVSGNINLPAGTYTISETAKISIDGYEWQDFVLVGGGSTITITEGNASSALEITVNNRYKRETGDLTITKAFGSGSAFDWDSLPEGYAFTIKIKGPDDWKPTGIGNPDSEGYYSFTFTKDYPTLSLTGIPVGRYYIYEDKESAKVELYTLDVTGERTTGNGYVVTSASTGENTVTAIITNKYTRDTGSLTVKKVVDGPATTQAFKFTVTFSPALPSGYQLPNGAAWAEGKTGSEASFTLMNSQSITFSGIPTNTKYTVTEDTYGNYEATWSGDGTVESGVISGKITDKSKTYSVECTNTRKTASLEVKKTVNGVYDGEQFTFTLTVDGNAWAGKPYTVQGDTTPRYTEADGTFQLGKGETAVFDGLPQGASYEVTESPHDYYTTTSSNSSGTVAGTNTAGFTNTRKTVGLSVTKLLDGDDAKGAFTDTPFTFTLYRAVGTVETAYEGMYSTDGGTTTQTATAGVFTLKADQTAEFTNLPAGVYKIVESDLTVDTVPNTITFTKAGEQTGTLNDPEISYTFTFTNKFEYKTGELKVTKAVPASSYNPSNKVYTLTLQKLNGSTWEPVINHNSGTGFATTNANGEFTLTANQTAHFKGLKNGTYRVVEASADISDYQWSVTYKAGASDVFETGVSISDQISAPTITVTNTYTRETGELRVTKTVSAGSDCLTPATFAFTLYIGMDKSNTYTGTYSIVNGDFNLPATNGVFTLAAGQTAVFTGLPTGVYTVVESDAGVSGHTWSMTVKVNDEETDTATAAVEYGETAKVEFTNTYTRLYGSLTVSKEVVDDEVYPLELDNWSYEFTISGPSDWEPNDLGSKNVDGSYSFTLDKTNPSKEFVNLPGGEYTVEEVTPGDTDSRYSLTTTVTGADSSGKIVIGEGGGKAVSFTNTYKRDLGSLTLTKDFSGIAPNQFGDESFTFTLTGPDGYYNDDIHLSDGGNWFVELDNLPTGTYKLRETSWHMPAGYSFGGASYEVIVDFTGPDTEGFIEFEITQGNTGINAVSVECTNAYDKDAGIIRVTKEADGYASADDEFEFRISSPGVTEKNYSYTVYDSEGNQLGDHPTETHKDGTFTLTAGQTAVFEGLDTETDYTVTELTSNYFTLTGMSIEAGTKTGDNWDYTDKADAGEDDLENMSMTGFMPKKQQGSNPVLAFTFTNKRHMGGLEVSKVLTGGNLFDEPFKIMVTFSDAEFSPEDWGVEISDNGRFEESCIVFTLHGGDKGWANGLPAGLGYTVSEFAGDNFYKVTYDSSEGTVPDGETAEHTVTNERYNGGVVDIRKSVYGSDNADESFAVEITFTAPNGAQWGDYVFEDFFKIAGPDYTYGVEYIEKAYNGNKVTITFSIRDDGQLRITDIPSGCTYELDEILTPEQQKCYVKKIEAYDGYVDPPIADNSKYKPEHDLIYITNYYIPNDSLVVTKTVDATPGSRLYTEKFDFVVKLFQPSLEDESSGWTRLEFDNQIAKAKELKEKFSEERKQIADELSELSSKNSGYASDYEAAGNELKAAENAYAAEMDAVSDAVRDDLDVQAEALAARDGAYEVCGNCDGTGYQTCGACSGEGEVTCSVCGGSGGSGEDEEYEPCSNCGGSGMEDCGACNGVGNLGECGVCEGGQIFNPDLADALEEAVYQDYIDAGLAEARRELEAAQEAFDNDPAVEIYRQITELLDEKDALDKKISALEDAINKLASGFYLTVDDEGNITEEWADDMLPLIPDADLFSASAWRVTEDGTKTLDLDDIKFLVNEDGTITFSLAHGEYVKLNGLPVGATYTITESAPGDYGGETFRGCTINGVSGLSASGAVSSDTDTAGKLYEFANSYDYLTGSIKVNKVWTNGSGSVSEIVVWLTVNGVRTDRSIRLNSENGWSGEFDGLEIGTGKVYGVEEDVPSRYRVSYSSNGVQLDYANREYTITVTNTRRTYPPTEPPTNPPETPPENPPENPPTLDIEEDGTPLAPSPEEGELSGYEDLLILDEETPLANIEEEIIPLGVPATGDSNNLVFLLLSMIISGFGLIIGFHQKKKKKN